MIRLIRKLAKDDNVCPCRRCEDTNGFVNFILVASNEQLVPGEWHNDPVLDRCELLVSLSTQMLNDLHISIDSLEFLGAGIYGVVFAGKTLTDEKIVIKVQTANLARHDGTFVAKNMKHEPQTLQKASSLFRSVPTVLYSSQTTRDNYRDYVMVTNKVDSNTTLNGWIDTVIESIQTNNNIKENMVSLCRMFDAYCDTALKLHMMGIKHNDFHEGNLLISTNGEVIPIDFSFAESPNIEDRDIQKLHFTITTTMCAIQSNSKSPLRLDQVKRQVYCFQEFVERNRHDSLTTLQQEELYVLYLKSKLRDHLALVAPSVINFLPKVSLPSQRLNKACEELSRVLMTSPSSQEHGFNQTYQKLSEESKTTFQEFQLDNREFYAEVSDPGKPLGALFHKKSILTLAYHRTKAYSLSHEDRARQIDSEIGDAQKRVTNLNSQGNTSWFKSIRKWWYERKIQTLKKDLKRHIVQKVETISHLSTLSGKLHSIDFDIGKTIDLTLRNDYQKTTRRLVQKVGSRNL